MRSLYASIVVAIFVCACGANPPAATGAAETTAPPSENTSPAAPDSGGSTGASSSGDDFNLSRGGGATMPASTLKPTKTEALLKLMVLKKADNAPFPGIVVTAIDEAGQKYYSSETDANGYAEMLVPNGRKFTVSYLALGLSEITKTVTIPAAENATIKLTLLYTRIPAPPRLVKAGEAAPPEDDSRLVLDGVVFDTAKATLKPESFEPLMRVVEYMTHKPNVRIELSGHTDNVGNPAKNKKLSEDRAKACRTWLGEKGIAVDRIEAVGFGEEQPIAPNDTEEGRAKNRRTEAREL